MDFDHSLYKRFLVETTKQHEATCVFRGFSMCHRVFLELADSSMVQSASSSPLARLAALHGPMKETAGAVPSCTFRNPAIALFSALNSSLRP